MRGARGGGGGVGPERGRQPAGDGGRGTGGRRVGGRCPLAALGRGAGRDRQPRAERAGEGGVARWPPSSSSCSPNFPALDGGEGTSLLRLPLGLLSPLSPACPPTPPSRRLSPGRGCGPSPPAEVRSGAANSLPRPCRGCEPAPSPPPRRQPRCRVNGKHRRSVCRCGLEAQIRPGRRRGRRGLRAAAQAACTPPGL